MNNNQTSNNVKVNCIAKGSIMLNKILVKAKRKPTIHNNFENNVLKRSKQTNNNKTNKCTYYNNQTQSNANLMSKARLICLTNIAKNSAMNIKLRNHWEIMIKKLRNYHCERNVQKLSAAIQLPLENVAVRQTKVMTIAALRSQQLQYASLNRNDRNDIMIIPTITGAVNPNEKVNNAYITALKDFSLLVTIHAPKFESPKQSPNEKNLNMDLLLNEYDVENGRTLPSGVIDFDMENRDDPLQVSLYAKDIFNYFKEREEHFKITAYMHHQPDIKSYMRAKLIDWMVHVQTCFGLNHETLYLAVKLVDLFLNKKMIKKERLQLVGAAAMFLASKYDERSPPMIDDFIYVSDNAFTRRELIRTEIAIYRLIDYDLGIPLSYRFLRRYARCGKIGMAELTLARYILEISLMNYDLITVSDSKIAATCLYIALRMTYQNGWNETLTFYSGYKFHEFASIVPMINKHLHQQQNDVNDTIRKKYSDDMFYGTAMVPLITTEELMDDCIATYL